MAKKSQFKPMAPPPSDPMGVFKLLKHASVQKKQAEKMKEMAVKTLWEQLTTPKPRQSSMLSDS